MLCQISILLEIQPLIVAKNVVIDSVIKDRDLNSAKWWLEKRQFNTAKTQVNIASKDMKVEFIAHES